MDEKGKEWIDKKQNGMVTVRNNLEGNGRE